MRLRDSQDLHAWEEFACLYAPLIHRFGIRNGLQDADAADLTQDVLTAISRAIGKLEYDPAVGRFRGWLFTIARNRIRNMMTRRRPGHRGSGDTGMHRVIEMESARDSDLSAIWDEEYQHRVFHWAADRVRPHFSRDSWRAFWETAVEGQKPESVAAKLGMSVGAVYIAKSRVIARLRETIARVGDE